MTPEAFRNASFDKKNSATCIEARTGHITEFCEKERENPGMGKYSDKNVVITGGGSGIGFAMAKLLVDGARAW
ncbi:hypothetical protein GCM10009609_57080 [Pseudonocardia aurantiaca]